MSPAGGTRASGWALAARGLLALAAAWLAAECWLALWAARTATLRVSLRPSAAPTDAVLMAGDATHSVLGAPSSETFAARLAPAARVVAHGAGNVDSGRMREELPALIGRYRPRVVYLCLGAADARARPGHPPPAPGFGSRLARLLLPERDARPPFAGVWHSGETRIEFGAGGAFRLDDQAGTWVETGDGLEVRVGGRQLPITVGARGRSLVLDGAFGQLALDPGPPLGDLHARAAAHRAAFELFDARRLWTVAASTTGSLDAQLGLLELDLLEGDEAATERRVARLRAAIGEDSAEWARVQRVLRSRAGDPAAAPAAPPAAEVAELGAILAANFDACIATCRAASVALVLVTHPAGPAWADEVTRSAAERHRMPLLDVAVARGEAPAAAPWADGDGVWTRTGHAAFARLLAVDLGRR